MSDQNNQSEEQQQDQQYMTTQQVADYLGKSLSSIYKYVKDEKLIPVYDHPKWKMRRTKLFSRSQVEQLGKDLEKPGMTTYEVAELLGVNYTTLKMFISEGHLAAEKTQYQGKEQYFIKNTDFDEFKESIVFKDYLMKKENKGFIGEGGKLLFQGFKQKNNGELARIMELGQDTSKVITESGDQFPIEELEKKGFEPLYSYNDEPYSHKKGYVKFKFVKPYSINSNIYKLIERLYFVSGHRNMKVLVDNDNIHIQLKPIFIDKIDESTVELLRDSLIEGNIHIEPDGVIIESDFEPLNIFVPSSIKKIIREKAVNKNKTIEEVTLEYIQKGIEGDR